jgi:L-malate glycosyltransferase
VKLLVTTTLSPNQLRAHLGPIVAIPEVEEVVLVTDEEPPPLPKLVVVVPTRTEKRLLGRAGSKLVQTARLARRLRPAWVLSYNIMPHAVNGLLAARVSRSRTIYHMIGGDTEWRGGGWRSENAVLGRLPRPTPAVEKALLGVMQRTDIVCTMGARTRERLITAGLDPSRVIVAPPAIDVERFAPLPSGAPRRYDLMTAGRLVAPKRVHDFVAIVRRLKATIPTVRAAIAGAGPLETELREEASRQGVADAIDFLGSRRDIEDVYGSARVFVLTSAFEGFSVALSEALACGLPAVVTDVGDLRDLIVDGSNGSIRPVGDIDGLTAAVEAFLSDDRRYDRASKAARQAALERSVPLMTMLYRNILLER